MIMHLIKEEHQKENCPYCKNDISKSEFESEFENHLHYKTAICECGKKVSIKVGFDGSGHDKWNKKRTIEHKIKA